MKLFAQVYVQERGLRTQRLTNGLLPTGNTGAEKWPDGQPITEFSDAIPPKVPPKQLKDLAVKPSHAR